MKSSSLALLAAVVISLPSLANASMIVQLVDPFGNDSGWDAILTDNIYTGIVIDEVTNTGVEIEITKTLYEAPREGRFPSNVITFQQRLPDANAVATICIKDEIIINLTGYDWTDYHWQINGTDAAFNRTATVNSGFDTTPFVDQIWGVAQTGWDAEHPAMFEVETGLVPNGGLFYPGVAGGNLYIDVDLSGRQASFQLEQYPTPEPGALATIILGGAAMLARRSRKRIQ